MAAAIRLERVGLFIGVAVAIGLGALIVPSFLISADSVRDAISREIKAVTGLEPTIRGPVTLSFFPPDTVRLGNVALGSDRDGSPALSADVLTAHLRLLPLLAGRVEIASIALERPRIAITFPRAGGPSNWATVIESLTPGLKPKDGRGRLFSEIHISEGTILINDPDRKLSETLTKIDLSLAWPTISKSFAASGRFIWRNELIDASVSIVDLYAALVGDVSGLRYRLTSGPFNVAFDGTMSTRPTLKISGALAADASSLRDALRWAGATPPPGDGFGRFALKAQTTVVGGTIALSSVQIALDGNAVEGVLTYAGDGRRTVDGTLAAEDLNLGPYAAAFRLMTDDAREWNRRQISLDGFADVDLDLRLSAAGVTIGEAKLGRTAFAVNLRGGRLGVTVGESQAFGGVVSGSFALAKSEAGAEVKSAMRFANVDLDACFGQLFGLRRVDGKGNFAFDLEGSGNSIAAITRTVNGTMTLAATAGALTGLNVEQLLRRLERRPLSGGGDFRNGRTPYDTFNVALRIAQGVATADDARLEGSAVRLAMTGTSSIPAREWDLQGSASLVTAPHETPAFELPFVVQGSWDEPILLPDTQSLIRRSGAAAPLLDAVRERKTRDAVRATVDRLRGGAQAEQAPAGAGP